MHDPCTIFIAFNVFTLGEVIKTVTIQNQYDGPRAPTKPLPSGKFNLDFAISDDATEIDTGIRETIKGVRLSILAMGIALARFKAKEMYITLAYRSMNEYLENLCDEMQVDRTTTHNWLLIGEAWNKHQKDLKRIDFSDADGPTKLPYVDRALEKHEKREVFRNVKDLSLRAFKEYSKGESPAPPPSIIKVVGNKIYVNEKLAVTIAKDINPQTLAYLTDINVKAGEALEAGEVLYLTRLYDMAELRRFERGADRLKKELRKRK